MKRAAIGILLALVAVGAYAWAPQSIQGDAATDLRTIGAGGAVWGLYVVGDGFFASVALASLVVACVIRVLRVREMESVARMALPLGVAGLLASLGCVLADLGRPMAAIVNLPLVGRPRSPFFGTFTVVAGASLFASVVQLVLANRPGWAERAETAGRWPGLWRTLACGWKATASARRRRARVDFWLSLALLPLLLGGFVILGIVFAVRAGRPAWQGRFELAAFVVSGGAAGCSLLLVALAAQGRRSASVFVARILAVLTSLAVLLVVSAQIWALRTPHMSVQRYARALLEGPWSGLFWTELVLLFLGAILALAMSWRKTISLIWEPWKGSLRPSAPHPPPPSRSLRSAPPSLPRWCAASEGRRLPTRLVWAATTALLVCAAVFVERFLLLVVWQTHGLGLPWPAGTYQPTWVEWSVLVGVAAAAVLVFLILADGCPAQASPTQEPASPAPAGDRRRLIVTMACLALGLVLAGAGLALSAGLASAPFLDPILPGSPLVFLAGLFLMVSAAIVYELIPERPR